MSLEEAIAEKKTRKQGEKHIKHVYRLVNLSLTPIPEIHSLEQIEAYVSELIDAGWNLKETHQMGLTTTFGEHSGLFAHLLYVLTK